MSHVVLHMDKYKREAVRGIQSHNQRERKSRSNPDIDYERSTLNYDLYHDSKVNFNAIIDQRIDSLNLKRAPRHDAVCMCGIIVSSVSEFFQKLSQAEQRRFFLAAKEWLEEFVGRENVIAATVHLDEKTPHMHFSHVPVTKDGRLCAKDIYTRATLKRMQDAFPKYLQSRGFKIDRGVAQEPGSAKKHLDTREFKQQQESLNQLRQEAEAESEKLVQLQADISRKEAEWRKRLGGYEKLAAAAEKVVAARHELPTPGLLKAQAIHDEATAIIRIYQNALADKLILKERNQELEKQQQEVDKTVAAAEAKVASYYEALKKEADQIQKALEAKIARLQQEVKGKESVIKHLQQRYDDYDRLKAIEQKWLELEREKEVKARLAEEAAKAQRPQPVVRKAPMLQPLSPQQSQPQREEQKNRAPGR